MELCETDKQFLWPVILAANTLYLHHKDTIFNTFLFFLSFQETTQIEEDNNRVEKEVRDLQKQIEELHALLKEHDCPKQLPYSGGNVWRADKQAHARALSRKSGYITSEIQVIAKSNCIKKPISTESVYPVKMNPNNLKLLRKSGSRKTDQFEDPKRNRYNFKGNCMPTLSCCVCWFLRLSPYVITVTSPDQISSSESWKMKRDYFSEDF